MDASVYEGELIERRDFCESDLSGVEYFSCTFRGCDFSGARLSAATFSACVFDGCNLSMTKLDGARLQDATFKNCKLVGVDFSVCSDFAFAVTFEQSNLHLASFWSKVMQKTRFAGSELRETNFSECDLSGADFAECEMSQAVFAGTNLERANFRGARNFAIDPAKNRLKKAKFSRNDLEGLLYQYDLEVE